MASATLPQSQTKHGDADVQEGQNWLHQQIVGLFGAASRQACTHPICTLLLTAVLASSTYTGLLDGGIVRIPHGTFNASPFRQGSRSLQLGQHTSWRWQAMDNATSGNDSVNSQLALATLVFPGSMGQSIAPSPDDIAISASVEAKPVPSTRNVLSSFSQGVPAAFLVPYVQLNSFLEGIQEIPVTINADDYIETSCTWTINTPSTERSGATFKSLISYSWASFLDRIKHADIADIDIMALGYLSMCLTFVSLFSSMRHLGSRFWLAASVLLSGFFAFCLGLAVTRSLCVPINALLLSEGIPFLVVTVGFEKSIMLTRAVLRASSSPRKLSQQKRTANGDGNNVLGSSRSIEESIQIAIREEGFPIIRSYAIEIALLAAGAAAPVHRGLPQFCCLAAWILFFDCILLFTFYATILCVKLEITQIRQNASVNRAPEDNSRPRRVAIVDNALRMGSNPELQSQTFGYSVKAWHIPKLKLLMVGGFIFFNILNLFTVSNRAIGVPLLSRFWNIPTPMSINPFKVASNGLEELYVSARASNTEARVTVLSPITFALKPTSMLTENGNTIEHSQRLVDAMGGHLLGGILASLEDPAVSKLVIAALALSLVLNSYLMNATRWNTRQLGHGKTAARVDQSHEDGKQQRAPKENRSTDLETALKEKTAASLEDEELAELCVRGKIPGYALEKTMEDERVSRLEAFTRAVKIRRAAVSRTPSTKDVTSGLEGSKLPYQNYNYALVHGACCENVIGYLPLPLGLAGPLVINGQSYFIPMATTEGVLVASASRGCKAINAGGGATTVINSDGMTRGPCLGFPSIERAAEAKRWIDSEEGRQILNSAFSSTSRFARLQDLKAAQAGAYLYVRFKSATGDAMGMNMISKGVEKALHAMKEYGFDNMATISVTGNYCADKKASGINWIDGRGKSVVAEAVIPREAVRSILKTDVEGLVELNTSKNLIGSAMAGSIGGFNAHASNLVTAVFLATGQDPAQNVESSSCITIMKNVNGHLHISVSMPSVEVGTIGGGTILDAQSAMLDMLGVQGAHSTDPGENARQLARITAAAVLAGELSTCAALSAGHLVSAHMAHNRIGGSTGATTSASGTLRSAKK